MRNSLSEANHSICYIYEDIYNCIIKLNKIPIAIYIQDYSTAVQQVKLCDGIIISGGDDFSFDDIRILNYLYDENIPTLGICLGMQTMGCLFNGNLIKIKNHKSKKNYVHKVFIKDNSILCKALKTNCILVNSRHNESVVDTNLLITGKSEDGTIELVEAANKHFFVGVQWHPETMFEYDLSQRRIMEFFIKGEYNEFK